MNFQEELSKRIQEVNESIYTFLPEDYGDNPVVSAMHYSIKVGGKRIRPILMQELYRLCGGDPSAGILEPFMAAMEMLHTCSLVHDDLPCMDNDKYRRGKETTWFAYGETIATLAGDALLNASFETALLAYQKDLSDARIARALIVFAQKIGIGGMIGGQCYDVISEGKELSIEELNRIYRLKCGALLEGSMMIGAILSGAGDRQVLLAEKAGADIGLAFQIQDDVLDVIGSQELLGKDIGSDAKNQKSTYAVLCGVQHSQEIVSDLSNSAMQYLYELEEENPAYDAEFLNSLVTWMITREN